MSHRSRMEEIAILLEKDGEIKKPWREISLDSLEKEKYPASITGRYIDPAADPIDIFEE